MKINVINLPHRTDRLNAILFQTEKLNKCEVVMHQAVNGQREFFNYATTKRMRGHYGCLQSHRNLLKEVAGKDDIHIVFEDDVVFCDDFTDRMIEAIYNLPKDWSLLYLGGNTFTENSTEPYNDIFSIAKEVYTTHAYIINDKYIKELQQVLEQRLGKVDVLFVEFQKKFPCYIVNEHIAVQSDSVSDIDFKPGSEV